MKCQECSELLIDYLHGELSPELNETVGSHMSNCSKCSIEFEEYAQIQKAAQVQTEPKVSSEVIENLSKAASDKIRKVRTPFWKKWSYSPILVPTLTTAIALSVWFYYGEDAVNLGPVEKEQVVLEMKTNTVSESDTGSSLTDEQIETDNTLGKAQVNAPSSSKSTNKALKQSQTHTPEQLPDPAVEPNNYSRGKFNQEAEELTELDSYQPQERAQQSQVKVKALPQEPNNSDDQEKVEIGLVKENLQREQFEASPRNIADRDCEESIRINEAIINSANAIPKRVQKRSYITLAQCYEQKGNYDKAIANYIKLEQIAPEESSFANSRIQEIKNTMRLEQGQQKQLSDPQPVN